MLVGEANAQFDTLMKNMIQNMNNGMAFTGLAWALALGGRGDPSLARLWQH